MCLILVGKTEDIQEMDLAAAWRCNSDGAGIVLPERNPVVIKGIMSLKRLQHHLRAMPQKREIAVHLRMATHGSVSKENTHPFEVDKYSVLMHNGILSSLGVHGRWGESDSAHLARILSRIKHTDRLALLKEINGKYVYSHQTSLFLVGGFTTKNNVSLSNEYWMHQHHNKYLNLDEYLLEKEKDKTTSTTPLGFVDKARAEAAKSNVSQFKNTGKTNNHYKKRFINGVWEDEPDFSDMN